MTQCPKLGKGYANYRTLRQWNDIAPKIKEEAGKLNTVGDPTETALVDLGIKYNIIKE